MKSHFLLFLICVTAASNGLSAEEKPIDSALAIANALDDQQKFAEELKILQPYAESGNVKVEYSLASAYMEVAILGHKPGAIPEDAIRPAIDFAQRAVKHGGANGNNLLALIYSNGWGVPVDSAKGAGYLRRGSDAGDEGAKMNYAVALYQGAPGIPRDVDRSCSLFGDLIKSGKRNIIVGYYAGIIIFRGQCGKPADKAAGVELIRIAADHGYRDAERDMAKNSEFGWTGPTDIHKMIEWYQKAADHGDPESQWWIGMAYVNGKLGSKDSVKGVQFLEQSAASDDPRGLVDLGVMYVTGDGVAKDFVKARMLYEKAAEQRFPHAFRELGAMYANGEGVAVDLVRARVMYLQSVSLGEQDDDIVRKSIESKLDAAQINESDIQFGQWRRKQVSQ